MYAETSLQTSIFSVTLHKPAFLPDILIEINDSNKHGLLQNKNLKLIYSPIFLHLSFTTGQKVVQIISSSFIFFGIIDVLLASPTVESKFAL